MAFVESSFFPIPPDLLLIPMVLADRTKAWRYAVIATVASVIGGMFGYAIGAFLFEQIAMPILQFYGYEEQFRALRRLVQRLGRVDRLRGGRYAVSRTR